MTDEHLTICIPAFNEGAALPGVLAQLRARFPQSELLVIDDGSTDDTAAAAAVPGVTVLRHPRNLGYGASLKTAMRASHRPVIAWCDADGQHSAADLATVVAPVLAGEADGAIGARAPGSAVRLDRLPGKWLLTLLACLVARARVPDLNSGLRCFRRDIIMRYLHLLPNGFSASATSTLVLMKRGYRLAWPAITVAPRTGHSSVHLLRDGVRTVHLMLRLLILFDAFPFFSCLGGCQMALALIYGLMLAYLNRQGFPVLAAMVFISGILTFFMGLLCDQIVTMRLERFESSPDLPPPPPPP